MTDTERLDWLVRMQALVRFGGIRSADPFFFIEYKSGETSDQRLTYRDAIDAEMERTK